MVVPDHMRISLRPVDHKDGINPAGLFLTMDEFVDMVGKPFPERPFEGDFLDYVFSVTTGHTGAVTDLLAAVEAHEVSFRIKLDNCFGKYSLEIFQNQFSVEDLWSSLDQRGIFKHGLAFPIDLQKPELARVFREVLCNHSVTPETFSSIEDTNALDECFRRGWLHATMIRYEIRYIFATLLHQWFVGYYLETYVAGSNPSLVKPSLLLQSM